MNQKYYFKNTYFDKNGREINQFLSVFNEYKTYKKTPLVVKKLSDSCFISQSELDTVQSSYDKKFLSQFQVLEI